MTVKTITITEEAYERLKAKKAENESFTDVINKLTKKGKLSDFAGILNDKEANEMERKVKGIWEGYDKRLERIKKRLRE